MLSSRPSETQRSSVLRRRPLKRPKNRNADSRKREKRKNSPDFPTNKLSTIPPSLTKTPPFKDSKESPAARRRRVVMTILSMALAAST
jgi:hypothetical protein